MTNSPNVLMLISDQHSKHHLGCYGDSLVRTPHLDRLASEGMRFDDAYTASPVCVPSRMSFMSCRRPSATRVWNNHHLLHSGIPTWAHSLGAAGIDTALIGRMHFNGPDQRHGFGERPLGEYGAIHPGAPRVGKLFTAIPTSTTGQCREAVEIAGAGSTSYQAMDELVAARTCDWLRTRAESEIPFAAVSGFLLPHCPFIAPPDLFDYYYDRVDIPEQPGAESQPAAVVNFRRNRGILDPPLPEERVRVARAAYFGMCEHLDRQIGKILDCLDETGLADNTLVIYVSDHGEMAGEHGCWWKSNYYEGSVGVPMVARWPGEISPGSSSREICNLMDLGVTLTDLMQAPALPQADGHSLLKTLRSQDDPDRPGETYSEHGSTPNDAPSRMIRRGKWKLTKYADDTAPILFDLDADPGELHDLGEDPGHTQTRDELLRAVFDGWDPAFVSAESARLQADMDLLSSWGRIVAEPTPDSLPVPENVEDIDLR